MITVIAGLKGGVGKTTVTLALASACVAAGRRILLVDMDPGATLTLWAQTSIGNDGRPPTTVSGGVLARDPEQLRALAHGYHAVLVDCPAQDRERTAAAMSVADRILLPCSPAAADVWGLARALDLAAQVAVRPAPEVILNRVDARRREHLSLRRTLAEIGAQALETTLHGRAVHADAMASGTSIHELEPRGPAAAEADALLQELARPGVRPGLVPAALH